MLRHADNRLAEPARCSRQWIAEYPEDGTALLTNVTLTGRPERLHRPWKLGRRMATELARDHDVVVRVAQHVPGKMGRSTDPHLHLAVAGPRRIELVRVRRLCDSALGRPAVGTDAGARRALLAGAGAPLA